MAKSPLYKYDPNDPNQSFMADPGYQKPGTARYARPVQTQGTSIYDYLSTLMPRSQARRLSSGYTSAPKTFEKSQYFAPYKAWAEPIDKQFKKDTRNWVVNDAAWNMYDRQNAPYSNWLTQTGAMRNAVNAQNQADDLVKAQERANRFASRGSKYTGSRSLYGNMTGA